MRSFRQRPRCGFVMMMVLILMAAATVMVYALLANSIKQAATTANQPATSQADALAESGVELAMYYLQHPNRAPSIVAATATIPAYWAGASNITFAGASGSVTVAVAPSGATGLQWSITSTGKDSSASIGSTTKTLVATALVSGNYQIPEAIGSNSSLSLGSNVTINGAILANGTVSLNALAKILGSVLGAVNGVFPTPISNPVPTTFSQLRSYTTYTYAGVSHSAAAFNTSGGNTVTASNPGGVFKYTAGNLTITGPMTIPGTLLVTNGNLTIKGNVNIGPAAPGLPALVVSGNASFGTILSQLNTSGSVYLGTGIGAGDITSQINIIGSLLLGSGGISGSFLSSLSVTYNSTYANLPDMTPTAPYLTPLNVKLTAWAP